MELIVLLVLALLAVVVVGAVMGILAKLELGRTRRRIDGLAEQVRDLRQELRAGRDEDDSPAERGGAEEAAGLTDATSSRTSTPPPLPSKLDPAPSGTEPPEPPRSEEPRPEREPEGEPETESGTAAEPDADDTAAAIARVQQPVVPPVVPPPLPSGSAAGSRDEPPPPGAGQLVGMEKTVGLRWLTWVGIGLLFLGVAFFLKYAYDRDWLGRLFGPRLRLATAAGAAVLLIAGGWRSLRNGFVALGQGLLGGGQALLYLTVFAAFQPAMMVVEEPLLGPTTAFALMVAVTIAGLAVAVRLDAVAMAFLAVLGGFATPVLMSTGRDARDLLCAYLLLLDLGVLGVTLWRRWRALDLLAFAGTVLLFGGWWASHRHAHPQPDATVVWLAAFHLVFLLLPFLHHWRRRTPVTVERFALALLNVAWTMAYGAWLLHEPAPRLLAGGCLVASVLYLGLGVAVARRVGGDRRTRDGFLALAVLLLTLGLFYLLPLNAITTAWFAEAAALVWLGYRHGHGPTRFGALVILGVAIGRTTFWHLPAGDPAAPFIVNRWFGQLVVAALGLAVVAALHRRRAQIPSERTLSRVLGTTAGLWLLLVASLEILRHARGHPSAWDVVAPASAITWVLLGGVGGFLAWTARWPQRSTFIVGLVPLAGALVAAGIAYGDYPPDALVGLNGRCLAGLAVCAATAFAGARARRQFDDGGRRIGNALFGIAQLLLTALATVEVAAFMQRGGADPGPRTMAQVLGWVWLALAIGGGVGAALSSGRRVLELAAIPYALAAGVGLVLYVAGEGPFPILANERFVFVALVAGALAFARPLLQRIGPVRTADPAAAGAFVILVFYGACEAVAWSNTTHGKGAAGPWIAWLLGVVAVLGTAGGRWRARATGNTALRGVALVTLAPALVLPIVVYLTEWRSAWMFLNPRAGLVGAAIGAAWLWAREESTRPVRWVALAVGLLALTLEPPVWILAHVEESGEAERRALFSITVTWVVTAVVLLVVGFTRDRRPLRLLALALLALTAAKVLVLDMSGAQQLYRILAFILVGVTFVGASWLYHRLERRLAAPRE